MMIDFILQLEKIIDDLSQASYPKEPYYSFLDHILITKEIIRYKVIQILKLIQLIWVIL